MSPCSSWGTQHTAHTNEETVDIRSAYPLLVQIPEGLMVAQTFTPILFVHTNIYMDRHFHMTYLDPVEHVCLRRRSNGREKHILYMHTNKYININIYIQ